MSISTPMAPAARLDRLETVAFFSLLAFVAALQVSIAASGILLAFTGLCWAASVVMRREPIRVPAMFWPLAAYAAATLVSAIFSRHPATSLVDCKQLLLFLIVPIVYRLARGERAITVANVIITVGALSALVGLVQYGILHYDNLGRRPQGVLTHYMTYSGLLMLVTGAAAARVIYRTEDRVWPALVLPALLVALALSFTRSAWVGACAAVAVLLVIKDRRLLALLPVGAALFIAIAPVGVSNRMWSIFDPTDPTNRDRMAMLRSGTRIVADHPLTGVGPNMVKEVYPEYRDPTAVEPINVHLHDVPMQIAAERGLPALALWLWFIVVLVRDMVRMLRASTHPSLAAGGLAAMVGMLAAGFFEYNFGDSEFLMLFLVLVTLPYAARQAPVDAVS
jgi:O-antigen ligase